MNTKLKAILHTQMTWGRRTRRFGLCELLRALLAWFRDPCSPPSLRFTLSISFSEGLSELSGEVFDDGDIPYSTDLSVQENASKNHFINFQATSIRLYPRPSGLSCLFITQAVLAMGFLLWSRPYVKSDQFCAPLFLEHILQRGPMVSQRPCGWAGAYISLLIA